MSICDDLRSIGPRPGLLWLGLFSALFSPKKAKIANYPILFIPKQPVESLYEVVNVHCSSVRFFNGRQVACDQM